MPWQPNVDPLSTLDPSAALDGSMAVLVGTTVLAGAVALALARWRPARLTEEQLAVRPALRRSVELLLPALILAWGLALALRVQGTANPQGLPIANDLHEYLGFVVHWLDPELGYVPPFRYPLWAWLAARTAQGAELAPYAAAMGLGLVAAGLLPVALYALARQLAPAGVAFAAALLVGTLPAFQHQMGAPSDYMLSTTLGVLALASAAWALLRGGWLPHGAAGLTLALNMACSYRAFTTTVLALALLALGLAWRAWKERPTVLLHGLAVAIPLVAMWWIYGHYHHAVSLETAVMVVHQHMAQHRGASVGWLDYPISGAALEPTGGSWVVGQPGALRGLPWTLAFLLDASRVGGRFGLDWAQLVPYLRHALSWSWLGWLVLAVPAGLAAGAWTRRPGNKLPHVLAAVLVLAVTGLALGSLRSLPQAYRYFLPSLVLLPTLALCGAAALLRPATPRARAAPLLGLPVALLAAVLVAPTLPLGQAMSGAAMAHHYSVPQDTPPSNRRGSQAMLALANIVGPDDQVVDLTHARFSTAFMLDRVELLHTPLRTDAPSPWALELPPRAEGRRFLFDVCFGNMDAPMQPVREQLMTALEADPRWERWGPCAFQDLEPGAPWAWMTTATP